MIGKTNAISGVSAPVPKIRTVSGSVISIADALAMPAVSLIADINAVQSGSGDPSPSNVRPISGWSNVNVYREAQYDAGATPYVTINLNGTRYCGSLDVTTGVLTVDRVKMVLNDASKWAAYTGTVDFYYNVEFGDRKTFSDSYTGLSCSYIQINSQASNTNTGRWRGAGSPYFGIKSNALTLEQIQTDAIAGKIEICYELATPQTVQLSPTEVQMLLGNNTLWADSGDSELQYWARR